MARLFLIRHGEPDTVWGGGGPDPGLSGRGQVQAEAAARTLLLEGPLAIVSSPMRRCRQTAAPLEKLAKTVSLTDPRVSEVLAPRGVTDRRAWLRENFPWADGRTRAWATLDAALHAWRAETLAAARAVSADTAMFSHFIAINAIVGAALGREDTIVRRPDHASITELEVAGGALRLVRMGAELRAGEVL